MSTLADNINLAVDTRGQRIDELGRIIMAYSELTERLQQSHEQLKGQVVKLRGELSEKNRMLERRNRLAALGEMAAGLAHEIRNPLGGIQLYAGMLGQDVSDRPASLLVVNKITNGVKQLEWLVSQVLQFTREMRPVVRECDLAEVLGDALDLAEPKAAAAEIADCCLGMQDCVGHASSIVSAAAHFQAGKTDARFPKPRAARFRRHHRLQFARTDRSDAPLRTRPDVAECGNHRRG